MSKKDKLFSVTIHDCRVDTYRGSGKGGQNRNKRDTGVRVTHEPSGAVGQSEEERSQWQNKKTAFGRMARTKEFQAWIKLESAKRLGILAEIEKKVDKELRKVKVEVHNDEGLWIEWEDKDED